MRYLLSSVLLVLFVSCASYPKKNGFTASVRQPIQNPYFSDASKDYVYKANIVAFGNSFSGIFIVKKLGEDHHRIAFTTEMGNKIFDFTFQGEDFKVNHILKKMDKKILINVLKNDFRVLVKENPSMEKTFQKDSNSIYETKIGNKKYYHFLSKEKLNKVVRVGNGKEKVEFTFSEINDNIALHIQILHKNIELKISLKSI
ncbi:hypothetical protein FEE95_03610 [Maribacter algarum]|uniref:DUF4292 domain-containing protein n=1 Tax=Maribacter algarum (ex Zhang et al. 2020) TaxID=2578118 RepID=A0A5S3PUA9_9FLAO|nr:hypothetical protein [Maribacter algarum]TMM58530.1 hypothetical protein FEE95_03610 [Maribacter algarum]